MTPDSIDVTDDIEEAIENRNADPWCDNCGHAGSDHRPQIDGTACGGSSECGCPGYVPARS